MRRSAPGCSMPSAVSSAATPRTNARQPVAGDGVGIEASAEQAAFDRGRVGLALMRTRADAVRGTLEVRGLPGGGTEVRFAWDR